MWLTGICHKEESFKTLKIQGVSKCKKHWKKGYKTCNTFENTGFYSEYDFYGEICWQIMYLFTTRWWKLKICYS